MKFESNERKGEPSGNHVWGSSAKFIGTRLWGGDGVAYSKAETTAMSEWNGFDMRNAVKQGLRPTIGLR